MKPRLIQFSIVFFIVFTLSACASPAPTDEPTVVSAPTAAPTQCILEPIVVPTAAPVPKYAELDETTGLHFTGSVPEIDFSSYRLVIEGKVDNPLSLTYDDLRCMPRVEEQCSLLCPGFFQDQDTWAGVPLAYLLELAQIQGDTLGLKLVSADGYDTLISAQMAKQKDNFLAYEWRGEPLPIIHGFPVRAVFPAADGNFWAKWLVKIEVY